MWRKVWLMVAGTIITGVILTVIQGVRMDSRQKDVMEELDKARYAFRIANNYLYCNDHTDWLVMMEQGGTVTMRFWGYHMLGGIEMSIYNTEGKVYVRNEGDGPDQEFSFRLPKGTYFLTVDCSRGFLGAYAIGLENITALRKPVPMYTKE